MALLLLPAAVAVMVTVPEALPATVTLLLVWPLVPVTVVAARTAAPAGLTVQLTAMPARGWPEALSTSATRGCPKGCPGVADWLLPLITVVEPGVPGVTVKL